MLADTCVLAVVVFFIYSGYRAGLMRSLIKVASYLISIVASFFLYPIVSEALTKTPIHDKLVKVISENYQGNGITGVMGGNNFGFLNQYIESGIDAATGGIANAITDLLINIIAFVVILILSRIIIRIAGNLLGIFTKLPVIKQFNRLGGGIAGGLIGVLVIYIVCAVTFLFSPLDSQSRIADEIENSVFASEIYENNFILNFIGKGK